MNTTTTATTTKTLRVIPYSDNDRFTSYLAMAAHAGRNDRTGAKVHMVQVTVWKTTGRATMDAVNCSANGSLRGRLITEAAYGFEHVTCKKCGASSEHADFRNAKAIDVTFNF